jgi:hypothetical protein
LLVKSHLQGRATPLLILVWLLPRRGRKQQAQAPRRGEGAACRCIELNGIVLQAGTHSPEQGLPQIVEGFWGQFLAADLDQQVGKLSAGGWPLVIHGGRPPEPESPALRGA